MKAQKSCTSAVFPASEKRSGSLPAAGTSGSACSAGIWGVVGADASSMAILRSAIASPSHSSSMWSSREKDLRGIGTNSAAIADRLEEDFL